MPPAAMSGNCAPAGGAEMAQRVERERLERRARQAAGLGAMARLERGPRNGGVGDDQRVDPCVDRRADDAVVVAGLQVGRDFQEHRRTARRARRGDRAKQFDQLAPRLEIAQSRRVG